MKHVAKNANSLQRLKLSYLGVFVLCLVLVVSLIISLPANAAVVRREVASGNNAGATSLSIAMPAGTVMNDVMIAVISVRGGTGVTITPPAGWVAVTNGSANSTTVLKSSTYYKVAGSSESGPYSFTFATNKASGVIASYSGVDTANPVDVAGSAAAASNKAMVTPAVTTTVANTMLVAMFSNATGTAFDAGSGMTFGATAASTGNGAASRTTSGLEDVAQTGTGTTGAKPMTASVGAVYVGHLIALRPAPVLSQAGYRFFQNTDSTTASTAYAAAGSPASIAASTPFRLRLNIGVASGGSNATNALQRIYTLQYALRGADNTCDTSFTNETYTNVTTGSTVRFYNNATPADGVAYVGSANDPTRSGITAVGQKYVENNPLTVGTTTLGNQDMLWDIALTTSGASQGQTYCFRAIDGNGAVVLNGGYVSMPEFTIPVPTASQANYRWFANADSAAPGSPLIPQDTPASLAPEVPFRLRQRLAADGSQLPASYQQYKLQYAEKIGTCDIGFSGETYADIKFDTGGSASANATVAGYNKDSGGTAWSNVSYAAVADGLEASITASNLATSYPIFGTGFGFTIPTNATITGVTVNALRRSQKVGGGFAAIQEHSIMLYANGAQAGSDHATGASWDGTLPWGNSTDLWGLALTPADVNDATFGAAFQVSLGNDGISTMYAYIDSMTMGIYYTVPGVNSKPIQYYDNASASSLATIASSGNDPTNSSRPTVYQTYQESDPFTNSTAAIPDGSDGLWDFSLTSSAGGSGKTYCLRTVKQSGALLDSYVKIPEISFAGGPTLDQQLRGGQSVSNGLKNPFTW